ncbi:MAG: LysM peptidoglycan-binding domain-containing protein [Bacteroidia bacterium]
MIKRIFIFLAVCMAGVGLSMRLSAAAPDSVASMNFSYPTLSYNYSPDSTLIVNEGEVKAGLLYDVMNQKIVWQKNMSTSFPIASLTKMMVALLAVEDVYAGKISWNDNVHWVRSSVVGRRKNRRTVYSDVNYTLRDVFKAAMIASNNECADMMARFLSNGDLQATIDRMNERARQLGMMNTFYGNPTGLPAAHAMFDNSSTPTDLLALTLEMLKYPEVTEIASMGYATIENGRSTSVIRNHNHLTIDYSGEVDGLKTGYTRRAGFCLVATTAKCEHRLISIVLGSRGPAIRNEVVRDMINNYYTSIALDPLGPNCPNPYSNQNLVQSGTSPSGDYMMVKEKVKKIHVVRKGENLASISNRYGVSPSQLKSWNKRSIHNNRLLSGQQLVVYTIEKHPVFISKPANGNEEDDDQPILTDAEEKKINATDDDSSVAVVQPKKVVAKKTTVTKIKTPARFVYHTVAPGDTLFNIAQRYEGVTVAELKTLNKIKNIHSLKPGMKLKVKVQA